MKLNGLLSVLVLVASSGPALGHFTFKSRIPNADIVPHPCKANYMWGGVGHQNPNGGGERNPFGKDFKKAGYKWTETLCRQDSDGDGKTNGQELGDPNCVWKENDVPERVTDISHPGVCNPYGQGQCAGRDSFVDCTIATFGETCDVIKRPEIKTWDLRMTNHAIPTTETNYYCQHFNLSADQDLHMVANEGMIVNRNIVHHMLLFGCEDSYQSSPADYSPHQCKMGGGAQGCDSVLSIWTVGLAGTCFGDARGFRVGSKGYKIVRLEIHYNNPLLKPNQMDNSGLKIYYRPAQSNVQDLATFAVGQSRLSIPPGKKSVVATGSCPSECSKVLITEPMYAVSTLSHMHYMGRSQRTEVIRNGQVVKVLADDKHYSYDSPKLHMLDEPFKILPGDEIKTTCTYSSMSSNRYVFYGEATKDEMCFAFITTFPRTSIRSGWCTSFGPLSSCELYSRSPKFRCDWAHFTDLSNPDMNNYYLELEDNCNVDGLCRPECKNVTDKLLKHPCFGKEMNSMVSKFLSNNLQGARFLSRLRSCSGPESPDSTNDCKRECGHMMCDGDGTSPVVSGGVDTTMRSAPMTINCLVLASLLPLAAKVLL